MKKFKFGISFLLLILVATIFGQGKLLLNYFLALTFHELAHLFVAVKRGYKLKFIKLDMFGMSCSLNEEIDDVDSFAINIAGPIFNLALAIFCFALYYLIPQSVLFLYDFCFSNIVLALFNLIPVEQLDGGKIVNTWFSSKKSRCIFDLILRIFVVSGLIIIFVVNINNPNYLLLVVALFFCVKPKEKYSFSLFKFNKKSFEKIELLKVEETETLFNLLKKVKKNRFCIFYVKLKNNIFIDETQLIELASHMPLTYTIKQAVLKDIK